MMPWGLDASRRADHLIDVVQQLSLARDVDTVRTIVRRAARELTGADGATFVLRENGLCFYADEDAIGPLWKGRRFPMESCISGWSMLHREQVVIEDIYADPRIPHDAYRPTFVKSLAVVPIRTQAPIGAIGNYWAKPYRATTQDLRVLQALADSTSIALENVQIYSDLERRVAERTEELQFANAELDAFAARVSHDLRAPIRAIDGFSSALLEDFGSSLDPKARAYMERVHSSSKRMSQLVDHLLQLARVGRGEFRVERVELAHVAREIVEDLRQRDPDRNVEIEIQHELVAEADPGFVRIVLENLISNAWKYTQHNAAARIAFIAVDGAFVVRDNGVGFDPAKAGQLFQPFSRLHSQREFAGTGIGLATVRRIVERHGGRVWAESVVDCGASFYFTLPARGDA